MNSSTSATDPVFSWMKAMRSTSFSGSRTREACEMPSDPSSVSDFTNNGNFSRGEENPFLRGGTTAKRGTGMRW